MHKKTRKVPFGDGVPDMGGIALEFNCDVWETTIDRADCGQLIQGMKKKEAQLGRGYW